MNMGVVFKLMPTRVPSVTDSEIKMGFFDMKMSSLEVSMTKILDFKQLSQPGVDSRFLIQLLVFSKRGSKR